MMCRLTLKMELASECVTYLDAKLRDEKKEPLNANHPVNFNILQKNFDCVVLRLVSSLHKFCDSQMLDRTLDYNKRNCLAVCGAY